MTQLKFHQLDENVYYAQKDKNTISFIFVQWLDCTKEDLEEDAIKDKIHQYWVFQGDYITEKEINDIHQEALDLWNTYQDNIDDTNATEIIHNLTEKEAQDFITDYCKFSQKGIRTVDYEPSKFGGDSFILVNDKKYDHIAADEPSELLWEITENNKPTVAQIEQLVDIILEGLARYIDGLKDGSNEVKENWEQYAQDIDSLNTVEMAILRQKMIEKLYKKFN